MSRIQRKKPPKKKKQRIDADPATQESGNSGAAESKVALVESSAKEARKKTWDENAAKTVWPDGRPPQR